MIKLLEDDQNIIKLTNGILTVEFIKTGGNSGTYNLSYSQDSAILCEIRSAFCVINYYNSRTQEIEQFNSKLSEYISEIEEDKDKKQIKVILEPNSNHLMFSFKIRLVLREGSDFLLVKVIEIKASTENSTSIHSISPFTLKDSRLLLNGTQNPTNLKEISWFKNGWQSWSPCKTMFGNQKDREGPPIKLLRSVFDNQDYGIEGRFYSEYLGVITDLDSTNSLILGFTTLKDQFSRIILDYKKTTKLKLLTAISCMDGVSLQKSSINSSEELLIGFKPDNLGYYGLIDYAKEVKSKIRPNSIEKIPVGWCSWYYYYQDINQEEMLKNLEFFKKHKKELPVNFIQLDDGYQKTIGDYNRLNKKFSKGLHWLFKKIKSAGFKGGIWTAPFFAKKKSQLFKNHKNWFLGRTDKDKLLKTNFNWGRFQYSLDLSSEEVLEYLKDLFQDLSYGLKKDYSEGEKRVIEDFKIDFLHSAVRIESDYKNKNLTRAQILYNGVKAIREGITEDSFLLGCGTPLGPCVGLVDAMRIGPDTAPYWRFLDKWGRRYGFAAPSLKAGLLNTIYRSFMHNYFWINDPDCLMLRREDTKLNENEIELQMTIFGLSGGQILISDDMELLSKSEIEEAKLLIPPYNPERYDPIPSDILYAKYPNIYMLETNSSIGKRYLVALINWESKSRDKQFAFSQIIPNMPIDEEKFLIYDFWNRKFMGKYNKEEVIEIPELDPHSCRYLTIIPIPTKTIDKPYLLSTDLHITQGCTDIEEFEYLEGKDQINIEFELIGKRSGSFYLKLPKGKEIADYEFIYTLVNREDNIWKLDIQFKDKLQVSVSLTSNH
ncbi:MAG: alpha-galactosidase [Promethearchaeia archaeon]